MEKARETAIKIIGLSSDESFRGSSPGSFSETEPSNLTQKSDLQNALSERDSSALGSDNDLLQAKNERSKRKPISKKIRSPIPPRPKPVEKPPTPEPEPVTDVEEWSPEPPSREATLTPVEDEVYTPSISMPDLPEFELAKKEAQRKKSMKFLVEAPPELKEQPKKRKSPPKVRRIPKIQYNRKSRPAEAPVTSDKLQEIQDPLDFLAKYCIINPNRLPFYKLIFEAVIADQSPRYIHEKSSTKLSEHEKKLMKDIAVLTHGHSDKIGLSPPEIYLEKICYTLEMIYTKMESLSLDLQDIDDRRLNAMAVAARKMFPGITARDYSPPRKKKGRKGKKKRADREKSPSCSHVRGIITNDIVIERLTDDMIALLSKETEIRQLNLERERTLEKISDLKGRLNDLQGEKILADALSARCYFEDQKDNEKPHQFRRQQSQLYNTLRPDPDFEMNLDELEDALQQINNHLLTDQEFKFLYFILDLPGRRRINFRLFSVIAALSEKVTQLDPVIRKLINKFDYNALNVKMDKCKELFSLLIDDELSTPRGGASATSLALELTAGGLKPEHVSYVLSKFNREGKGVFDFMDFVTYIPLFIEIHQRIVKDPLCEDKDL
ncbi:uncharacterized protein LOC121377513 [Gigantopelta aegis]|uniref:uncharacterized protein LOC121377513 n=1 Tax=Gigantopelta aegis TaxID=1735272 RepID=UPI001B889D47|nr:uncharacterized protein LOC121377513 [Gigantopelta aegis]